MKDNHIYKISLEENDLVSVNIIEMPTIETPSPIKDFTDTLKALSIEHSNSLICFLAFAYINGKPIEYHVHLAIEIMLNLNDPNITDKEHSMAFGILKDNLLRIAKYKRLLETNNPEHLI